MRANVLNLLLLFQLAAWSPALPPAPWPPLDREQSSVLDDPRAAPGFFDPVHGHDVYVLPAARAGDPIPMPRCEPVTFGPFVATQVNTDSKGCNVLGDRGNEPSIAVNLANDQQIIIGFRHFDVGEDFLREAGLALSHDGGATWTNRETLSWDPPNEVFQSDPIVASDADGLFFYYGIEHGNDFRGFLHRSFDGGLTWDVRPFGGGDKPWMTIDTTNSKNRGRIYITTSWPYRSPKILKLKTQGTEIDDAPSHGNCWSGCTGRAGFVAESVAHDGAFFRSGFKVVDAQPGRVVPPLTSRTMPASTDQPVDAYRGGGPNLLGLGSMGWTLTNHSAAEAYDDVYSIGAGILRSTNRGLSWSRFQTIAVPSDATWLWFVAADVAPTGRIDVTWYESDVSNGYPAPTIIRYAYSLDRGREWTVPIQITPEFSSPWDEKLGDYTQIDSTNDAAHFAFAATFNNEHDVYYMKLLPDCNANGLADAVDIASGTSLDATDNGLPDECERDCNENGVADSIDIAKGVAEDCDENRIPDECDWVDCNFNEKHDGCDILEDPSLDCDGDWEIDACDPGIDCNDNSRPDSCDYLEGAFCRAETVIGCQGLSEPYEFCPQTCGRTRPHSDERPESPSIFAKGFGSPEDLHRGPWQGADGYFVADFFGAIYHVDRSGAAVEQLDIEFTGSVLGVELVNENSPMPLLLYSAGGVYALDISAKTLTPAPLGDGYTGLPYGLALDTSGAPERVDRLLVAEQFFDVGGLIHSFDLAGAWSPLFPADGGWVPSPRRYQTAFDVEVSPAEFGDLGNRVFVTAGSSVYVVDETTRNVELFAELPELGGLGRARFMEFSPPGWAWDLRPPPLLEPVLVVTTSGDNYGGARGGSIQMYTADGRLLAAITTALDGQPIDPRGLAFDGDGLLFTDTYAGRIYRATIDDFLMLDCDESRSVDFCDAEANAALDCDGNGALDACETRNNADVDADGDGHVTLRDFAAFANCLSGEGGGPPSLCCTRFDLRGGVNERAVDLEDASLMLEYVSGFVYSPGTGFCGNGLVDGNETCDPPDGALCLPNCQIDLDEDGIGHDVDRCLFGDDNSDADRDGIPDACDRDAALPKPGRGVGARGS